MELSALSYQLSVKPNPVCTAFLEISKQLTPCSVYDLAES